MFSTEVRYQLLATLCGNLITMGYGAVCGWPSASFLILKSSESPLATGPLTVEEVSWVAAIMCVGGFIGNIFFGWFSDRFGRKCSLIFSAFPQLLAWVLIIFAMNPTYLYVSRLLSGFSGGGVMVVMPLFVAEIANDRVRGTLGSLLVLSCNIGILFAFVLGNYVSYIASPIILLAVPLVFLVCILFFPETPQFLIKRGHEMEAEKSLRFYRNIKTTSNQECSQLRSELEKIKSIYQAQEKNLNRSSLQWEDFNNVAARKSFVIGVALIALNQFCGCFAMINYTATVFAEAGSDLSPNMAAIVVGVIQLVGSYFSTVLVDRAGRKFLLSFSATGTGLGLTCLGIYTYLQSIECNLNGYEWLPIASFSFTIFIASWGVLTLPFMVIAEIMPEKIRGFGASFCMSLLWIFAFAVIKCYPLLTMTLGMHGCMFLFATCSFSGALFVLMVLPETKGKSFEEIMCMLQKR